MEKTIDSSHTMKEKEKVFLYTQYRDAARQHLAACRRLIDSYPEWSKICNKHDEEKIFHEIYYLSGYILEGFVNYAIFCHPDWDRSCNVRKFSKDSDFSKHTHLWWNGENPDGFTIAGHNFQNNRNILDSCGYVVGIPYLSPDVPLSDDRIISNRLQRMIGMWKPDIRYKKVGEPLSLEFSDINNLISLCKKISDGIRNYLR